MKYYQQITLLPTGDISLYFLWQKIFQQVHLALVDNKNSEEKSLIGVAFPDYNAESYFLGRKLRLFAEQEQTIRRMNCEKWLSRLSDYVAISDIGPLPAKISCYVCFKHIKPKGNKEKLARRRAKRKGETMQEALMHFDRFREQQVRLPYINVISQTNKQLFRLFIEKQVVEKPQTGFFSCYGFSNTTTVPMF